MDSWCACFSGTLWPSDAETLICKLGAYLREHMEHCASIWPRRPVTVPPIGIIVSSGLGTGPEDGLNLPPRRLRNREAT